MTNAPPTLDIGALKRLRILCISETGWFDTATVFDDIRAAGGTQTDQYAIPWPPEGDLGLVCLCLLPAARLSANIQLLICVQFHFLEGRM